MSGIFTHEYPYTDFHELNLSWVIAKVKELIDHMNQIDEWKEEYQETVNQLQEFYNNLINGVYPVEFTDHLKQWIETNGIDIIMQAIKSVFFAITDEGYFIAYVPDSWEEISFGTSGLDDFPDNVDFGHLTLSY